ncbi:unnamed protein product, partial [Adineta steineri]
TLNIHQGALLPLSMSLFNCTFPSSIHYLHLENCKHYFNEEDCTILTHSSLTSQCKQLNILVKNCQSIIILVNNMTNLCTLRVRFTDENINEFEPSRMRNNVTDETILCKDEDIQWMINQLPPTCVITRHPLCINHIRIWLK